MPQKIEIGMRVKFARTFLQSTGQFTGWAPFAKGRVIALDTLCPELTIATVRWGDADPSRVNVKNLWPADRIHLEPV